MTRSSSSFLACIAGISLSILVISIPACKKKSNESLQNTEIPPVQDIEEEKEKNPQKKIKETELLVFTLPRDGGFVRRLEAPLHIRFSQAITPKDLTFATSPDPGGWKTAWEKEGKQAILHHTTPFESAMTYKLELHIKSHRMRKTVRFTAYGPTSIALIADDEKKGYP